MIKKGDSVQITDATSIWNLKVGQVKNVFTDTNTALVSIQLDHIQDNNVKTSSYILEIFSLDDLTAVNTLTSNSLQESKYTDNCIETFLENILKSSYRFKSDSVFDRDYLTLDTYDNFNGEQCVIKKCSRLYKSSNNHQQFNDSFWDIYFPETNVTLKNIPGYALILEEDYRCQ